MKSRIATAYTLPTVVSLLVTAGLVAWSATQVAGTIWHVLAPDSELSASGVQYDAGFAQGEPSLAARTVDVERLQAVYALRGAGQQSLTSEQTGASVTATETRLALTLKGAISSSDDTRSRAIIANAEAQDVYQIGDSLPDTPGSVVLQEIHPTYVLLNNNGSIETLRMDEPSASSTTATTASLPATVSVAPVGNTAAAPTGFANDRPLTDLVRLQPVFEAADSPRPGALQGLQIRHGSRQDFLAAVGLRQGDLITSVDGKPLNAADLPVLMTQLASQQTVSLQVLRDQTSVTVELDRRTW